MVDWLIAKRENENIVGNPPRNNTVASPKGTFRWSRDSLIDRNFDSLPESLDCRDGQLCEKKSIRFDLATAFDSIHLVAFSETQPYRW